MSELRVSTGYRPRCHQQQIHKSLRRFSVLVCHRRFGKTVLCINELIDRALRCDLPNPRYAYIAPLFNQAKDIAWTYLKQYTRGIPGTDTHETELRVTLPNGAHIRLYGADNPDRLRGIYLDGVVLDEYAQMSSRIWGEVIRPLLADRQGWAVFIGTPMGHNQFWEMYDAARKDEDWFAALFKASETDVLPKEELEAARKQMGPDEYEQEFECSFTAAIKGAYYGQLMTQADADERIGRVPYEPALPVDTWWDLGVNDSTSIWFVQKHRQEVRLIDYYEATGEGLAHYAKVLQSRPYVYGQHIGPHDLKVRELGTGLSRIETALNLGIRFDVAPNVAVNDGIQAVRNILPRCWFDAVKCDRGIEALRQYRRDWDEKLNTFRSRPLHDWSSHAADAFRYGALTWFEDSLADEEEWSRRYSETGRSRVTGY